MKCEKGQAVLDLAFSAAIVASVLAMVGVLLNTQWQQLSCSYLVFESTHAKLTGRRLPKGSRKMRFTESDHAIEGSARCGSIQLSVSLPKLGESFTSRWP